MNKFTKKRRENISPFYDWYFKYQKAFIQDCDIRMFLKMFTIIDHCFK